jgi:uncharacterized protein with HEPN domain
MPRDPRQFLYDVVTACQAIAAFCSGKSGRDYQEDLLLRSACERQFEIIGEAMTRLRDADPTTFAAIPAGKDIIAFRNRLIHGYDTVDSEIVWDVIEQRIPALGDAARRLLHEPEPPVSDVR